MALKLNRVRRSQPQVAVGINWGNPLTRGLVYADPGPALRNAINGRVGNVTGTAIRPAASGITRGFGSTLGVGSTDSVVTRLTTHATQRTYLVRVLRNGNGGGSLGRILEKRTAGAQVENFYWSGLGGPEFRYARVWSGAVGEWLFPTAHTASTPTMLAVTYDSSSTSNAPLGYVNGAPVTLTVGTTPSGTIVDNTDAYVVGNRTNDNARNWDGWIGEILIWDRILSPSEIAAISANPWQLFAPEQTIVPLASAAAESGVSGASATTNANDTSSASGTTTVTGTSATTNANDTSSASGTTTVTGTVAKTNANDTSSASGTTTVTGTSATTNANDTATASGTAGAISGTVAYTNANDTATASGWAGTISGTVAATNANDTALSSGSAGSQASGGFFWPHQRRRTRKEIDDERRKLGILPPEVLEAVAAVKPERRRIKLVELVGKPVAARISNVDLSEAIAISKKRKRQRDDELLLLM